MDALIIEQVKINAVFTADLSLCLERCGLSTTFLSTSAEGSVCRCSIEMHASDFSKGMYVDQ